MTLDLVLRSRRSVRMYDPTAVPEDKIREIIEAGMWAPSACNKQAWRFLYVDDEEKIRSVLANGGASFILKARAGRPPQSIIVLYDNRIDNVEYRDHLLSAAAAIENMLLKACESGIDTCWVCNLPTKKKMRKIFSIPRCYDPIALITLGYGTNKKREMPRKYTVDQVLHHNVFDREKDGCTEQPSGVRMTVKRLARRIYMQMPKTKRIKKIADRFEKKFEN